MNLVLGLLTVILCFSLVGCHSSSRETALHQYVAQLKATIQNKNVKHPENLLTLPMPVYYGAFDGQKAVVHAHQGIQKPLLSFPVKSLEFVGLVDDNQNLIAYLLTPDDMIYSARVGDQIGNEYATISKIEADHLEVIDRGVKDPSKQVMILKLKE